MMKQRAHMKNVNSSHIILILSILFAILGVYRVIQDLPTYFWTPVDAEIVHYEVRCCSSKGESESVYVQYKYQYLGQSYLSDSITLNYRDINNKGEKTFVNNKNRHYKVGQKLTAYASKQDAVLEQGIDEAAYYIFGTVIFFWLLSRYLARKP